jgi:DNA polymerase III beta subunit, central domain
MTQLTASIPLNRECLKVFQAITHAAAVDEYRPTLCAVRIDVEPKRLVLSATDSYLMVRRHLEVESPEALVGTTLLLDAKDLRKATTVALWDKSEDGISLTPGTDGATLAWAHGTWLLRPVDGPPIDLDKIIAAFDEAVVATITVNPNKLATVAKAAKALGHWPLRNGDGLTCTFHAGDRPIRIVAAHRSGSQVGHPDDFAMVMPVRRYN